MNDLKLLFKEYFPVFLYAIAAITGLIGGCTAAGHKLLHGKNLGFAVLWAYGVVGVFFGLLFLAHSNYLNVHMELDQLIASCLISGFAGSVMLASSNFTMRWALKRMGIEVQLTVKHKEQND